MDLVPRTRIINFAWEPLWCSILVPCTNIKTTYLLTVLYNKLCLWQKYCDIVLLIKCMAYPVGIILSSRKLDSIVDDFQIFDKGLKWNFHITLFSCMKSNIWPIFEKKSWKLTFLQLWALGRGDFNGTYLQQY